MGKVALFLTALLFLVFLAGCGKQEHLTPESPVSITVWHYYAGKQKASFDSMVKEFNDTVGLEQGVYVTAVGFGSNKKLSETLLEATSLPHIFMGYTRTATILDKRGLLVDLMDYFTEEELAEFVSIYLEMGYLPGGGLKILPIARSAHIGTLNRTDYDRFLEQAGDAEGIGYESLETFEGLVEAAEAYYRWTDSLTPERAHDGKSLYAINSVEDFMNQIATQMGAVEGLLTVKSGRLEGDYTREIMRKIWDVYYVGVVRGHCNPDGRELSKQNTGEVLYLISPTIDVTYFPGQVYTLDEETYPVEMMAFPMPYVQGGEKAALQRGAGMCITRSNEKEQVASALFLKWFTEDDRNTAFFDTGYQPVKKSGMEQINTRLEQDTSANPVILGARAYRQMFEEYRLVFYQPYEESIRLTEYAEQVQQQAAEARKQVLLELLEDPAREEEQVYEAYLSDEMFEEWYGGFCAAMDEIVRGGGL